MIAERKHFMENNRLLQILQKTVSEDEIDKLSAHTLPHISDFNRSVILEMLRDKLLAQEEISEEKVTALKNTLENYLQIYLPDQKDAWKWIILSCVYLCFICHKPLHPQEMVHYSISQDNNQTIYYCPMKSVKADTACVFCICRKTKSDKNNQR